MPICAASPGEEPALEGGTFRAPLLVQLHCATQGASIAYTCDAGKKPRWHLYTGPLLLPEGKTTLKTRAIRIGYRESEERVAIFAVEPAG